MLIEDLIERLQGIAKEYPGIKVKVSVDAIADLKEVDVCRPWDGNPDHPSGEPYLDLEG